jgi:preprotein translocase subunit SecA
MLDGLKEESVGFLFNVSVEAVPTPQVAQVQAPAGLAEFAAAAAEGGQRSDAPTAPREEAPSTLRAKGIDNEAPALTYSGPSEDGSAQVQRNGGGAQKTPAGVPAGASRRERRAAARQQGRGGKPPKSAKRR